MAPSHCRSFKTIRLVLDLAAFSVAQLAKDLPSAATSSRAKSSMLYCERDGAQSEAVGLHIATPAAPIHVVEHPLLFRILAPYLDDPSNFFVIR